ncbi:MAG: LysM peptidoglycan-binding domain-containing protein [Microgenomates group bacterium]
MKFNLKSFLKSFKTNESSISMVLGALVIVVVGILVVNYFKDRNGNVLPALSTTDGTVSAGEHVVAKGESLWSIAEDYYGSGYNWVDLATENNLTDYNLEVGQKLNLPEAVAKEPTSTKTQLTNNDTQTISGDSYTVIKGDSLWSISVRAYGDGYKWTEVAKANGLTHPNTIHSGNVLVLPR